VISLGADVGSGMTGLTVLSDRKFLSRIAVEPESVADVVSDILHTYQIQVVGIETMSQVFEHGTGANDPAKRRSLEKALLASRDVAGEIRGVVKTLRPNVLIYGEQAHVIRKAVIGRMSRAPRGVTPRTHRDRIVAAFVRRFVIGWPSGSGDNDHCRDGAVTALWAQRRDGRPLMPHFGPLPATKAMHAEHDRHVLRALRNGDLDSVQLRDEVAARVPRDAVGYATDRLVRAELITKVSRRGAATVWSITDAGRAVLDAGRRAA
jgi:hypothetical protein